MRMFCLLDTLALYSALLPEEVFQKLNLPLGYPIETSDADLSPQSKDLLIIASTLMSTIEAVS